MNCLPVWLHESWGGRGWPASPQLGEAGRLGCGGIRPGPHLEALWSRWERHVRACLEQETCRVRGSAAGLLEVPGHCPTRGFREGFLEVVTRDLMLRDEEGLNQGGEG